MICNITFYYTQIDSTTLFSLWLLQRKQKKKKKKKRKERIGGSKKFSHLDSKGKVYKKDMNDDSNNDIIGK